MTLGLAFAIAAEIGRRRGTIARLIRQTKYRIEFDRRVGVQMNYRSNVRELARLNRALAAIKYP